MRKKLIAILISSSMAMGTFFGATATASAITTGDVHYEVAFNATVDAVGYYVEDESDIYELQEKIISAREKISKLDSKFQEISVFNELIDERQQEVFVLLKNTIDKLGLEEKEPNICYRQYELNKLRDFINTIKKTCSTYPVELEAKIEEYQKEKIDKVVELVEKTKKNLTPENLQNAFVPVYDLANIDENHPQKEFVEKLYLDYEELDTKLSNSRPGGSHVAKTTKELLNAILNSETFNKELKVYFQEDKLNKSVEYLKKFIDDHDEEYINNVISELQKEVENNVNKF